MEYSSIAVKPETDMGERGGGGERADGRAGGRAGGRTDERTDGRRSVVTCPPSRAHYRCACVRSSAQGEGEGHGEGIIS